MIYWSMSRSWELAMARNRIQFQKGLSEAQFQALYDDDAPLMFLPRDRNFIS